MKGPTMAAEFLSLFPQYVDEGWTTDGIDMLICPCGNRVEDDGECPEGCVSPMLQEGMI